MRWYVVYINRYDKMCICFFVWGWVYKLIIIIVMVVNKVKSVVKCRKFILEMIFGLVLILLLLYGGVRKVKFRVMCIIFIMVFSISF